MELALTSCPGRDLSLPPPTPSCQGSFEAGDLWQKGGGDLFSASPKAARLQMALPSDPEHNPTSPVLRAYFGPGDPRVRGQGPSK